VTAAPRTLRQLLRYGIVGIASNALGFVWYLGLTELLHLGPKTAMSLLYLIGVLQTFAFNRKWTFAHEGAAHAALLRYGCAYALGYAVNLVALYVCVDRLGYPHTWVQGVMVIALAGMLFLLQKYWVFRVRPSAVTPPP